MAVGLQGFRALVSKKAGEIKAVGTKSGYEIHAAGEALRAEAGTTRVFKNLTTLARFVKAEGVNELTLDLGVVPKPPKASAVKAKPAKPTKAKAKAAAPTLATA